MVGANADRKARAVGQVSNLPGTLETCPTCRTDRKAWLRLAAAGLTVAAVVCCVGITMIGVGLVWIESFNAFAASVL